MNEFNKQEVKEARSTEEYESYRNMFVGAYDAMSKSRNVGMRRGLLLGGLIVYAYPKAKKFIKNKINSYNARKDGE